MHAYMGIYKFIVNFPALNKFPLSVYDFQYYTFENLITSDIVIYTVCAQR